MMRCRWLVLSAVVSFTGCALGVVRTRYSTPTAAVGWTVSPPSTPVFLGGDYHASVLSNSPFEHHFRIDPTVVTVLACTLRQSAFLWFLVPPLPPIPYTPRNGPKDGVPRVAMPERLTVIVAIGGSGTWSLDPRGIRLQAEHNETLPLVVTAREEADATSGVLSDFEVCTNAGRPVPLSEATLVSAPATIWLTFTQSSNPDQHFSLSLDGLRSEATPTPIPSIGFSPGTYTYRGFMGP